MPVADPGEQGGAPPLSKQNWGPIYSKKYRVWNASEYILPVSIIWFPFSFDHGMGGGGNSLQYPPRHFVNWTRAFRQITAQSQWSHAFPRCLKVDVWPLNGPIDQTQIFVLACKVRFWFLCTVHSSDSHLLVLLFKLYILYYTCVYLC